MRLRLLTFNAGLLKMFGRSVPAPYVPERLARLPQEIRRLDADIVLLQELYGQRARHRVAHALKDLYPHASFPHMRRRFFLANGLMTLSRYPASGAITLFRDAPADEAWLDSKGLLATTHSLPTGAELLCMNIHTTAGGLFHHPESAYIDGIRARQIDQILGYEQDSKTAVVLAGDLNAGPGVSESNFRQILSSGFVSLHDFLHGEVPEPTWDPSNPLNSGGPHKHCPPQRIDHVFLRAKDIESAHVTPLSSEICLRDPVVSIGNGRKVSVSDHYGLFTELEIASPAAAPLATA